jgi:hypothetical protein
VFIRIIATPPGEAPEEVRRAWIGLDLPLAAGETGPRTVPVGGVLTGPRTFLGKLFKLLAGRRQYSYGYVIDAPQALVLLAEKAPWAAQWWRECAPHCWQPGSKFVFAAEACAAVGPGATGWPPALARTPSERFFPAPAREVTHNPVPRTSSEQITEQPLPAFAGRRGFGLAPAPAQPLKWLAWAGGAAALLIVLIDYVSIHCGIGPLLVALAGGLGAGVLGWGIGRERGQEIERGQQPAPVRRRKRRAVRGLRTRQDAFVFLALGAVFCYISLSLLIHPLLARHVTPRMIGTQMIAPFQFSLGVLAITVALGFLFHQRCRRSPVGLGPAPPRAAGPRPARVRGEPVGPSQPPELAGFHTVKLIESGAGVLQMRPVPQRGRGSLADFWRGGLFRRACAAVKFDRNRGRRPRFFVTMLPGTGLRPLPEAFRKPRPLQDVAAVELAADAWERPDVPEAASGPTCQLRLRLNDPSLPILELAPHADEVWARETGGQLSRFLGVPLEDRIGPRKG